MENASSRPASCSPGHRWLDRIGAVISFTCAVHCLATPIALAMLPLAWLAPWIDPRWEWGLIVTTVSFASASVLWGIRGHREWRVAIPLLIAVGLIVTAESQHGNPSEPWLMGAAGLVFAATHLWNLSLGRHCGHAH